MHFLAGGLGGDLAAKMPSTFCTLAALPSVVLFRFFDILKPWSISYLDKHVHGGFGIMIDDVLAGLFALCVLHIGLFLMSISTYQRF